MEPQLNWLQSRFRLDDGALRSMVCTLPSVLGYHIENNIELKLAFYADILGEDESIRLVANDPRFLSYSLEKRIRPRFLEATELGMIVDKKLLSYLVKYTDKKWNNKVNKFRALL